MRPFTNECLYACTVTRNKERHIEYPFNLLSHIFWLLKYIWAHLQLFTAKAINI